ncbi:peptidoglycan DD-metalloendopeptidase family protein [Parapusillimonas granuli]|uniref:Peptidoglycan DD-metalloendopeptidase family protein n=1 Tax=Parapusillimonas granuli TaxID=380911 RepID=A0A853G0U3_9BURK|nr:peptidoglycan DD-metalloendopeptidase family protein [Parapusillimonas granuli]MEB2400911.1 peptidoglycan DD-metalloendopeptidase family protein [Alcaligenaceae bacterium]NYT50483.1 peptidoglycan DD-metalloendopeptidase family protein [Parapusillimonas granuli]
MQAGTFRSDATTTLEHPKRTSRKFMLAAVVASAVLAGCAGRGTQAPVTDMSQGTTAEPAKGGTYIVRPGDTLYKIAQAHNMELAELIRLNNITDPSQLRPNQVLRLDSSTPAPTAPAPGPATPVPVTPVKPVEPVSTVRANDASLISWAWPASGKIIQTFNANTKGIDIEGNIGDPVHAAADGKVMYAGNGVRGLGNLILLGHSNGFITAYAHNQSLLVKTGDQIKKGAKIAAIGQTDTTSPRLHFEIRRRGTPVNPMSYLPAR